MLLIQNNPCLKQRKTILKRDPTYAKYNKETDEGIRLMASDLTKRFARNLRKERNAA